LIAKLLRATRITLIDILATNGIICIQILAIRYCLEHISAIRRGKKESLSKESPFIYSNIQTKKDRLQRTVGHAVNTQPSAFTVLNFNTKGYLYGTDRKVFRRD
jgi:hypothetical protein